LVVRLGLIRSGDPLRGVGFSGGWVMPHRRGALGHLVGQGRDGQWSVCGVIAFALRDAVRVVL
jgi:hypothetical protein